eukprot:CAMPEP_0179854080 /NCGR_PEP_ID=MMETSP0982-20121206/9718_1 /TAXON_ID=483367 /ORGANISM="non described non described, Strain CCMP 2436" /LENGTH=145 /DNA_ID=CAMNT_0021739893 /DNA_START=17 /DNA_END=454 /DNA_ORIENTATION=+
MAPSSLAAALFACATLFAEGDALRLRPSMLIARPGSVSVRCVIVMQSVDPVEVEAVEPAADATVDAALVVDAAPRRGIDTINEWKATDKLTSQGAVLSWWAIPFVVYPVVLFVNDVFHFLPKENVLELIQQNTGYTLPGGSYPTM